MFEIKMAHSRGSQSSVCIRIVMRCIRIILQDSDPVGLTSESVSCTKLILPKASTVLSLRSSGEWEKKQELYPILKILRLLQLIIEFCSEAPGSSRPKWNQKDIMFSLPEQKATSSGDINMSLALNSQRNLPWEPLLKGH